MNLYRDDFERLLFTNIVINERVNDSLKLLGFIFTLKRLRFVASYANVIINYLTRYYVSI